MSRPRSVVVVALGLTTKSARMGGTVPAPPRDKVGPGRRVRWTSTRKDRPVSLPAGAETVPESTPATLRWAVRLLFLEGAGLAVLTLQSVYLDVTAEATTAEGALSFTGFL